MILIREETGYSGWLLPLLVWSSLVRFYILYLEKRINVMDMLTVTDVRKSFGSKVVVDGLSFSIPKNSIFGFVGENGAGKTTTMKMILGLMKMDSGEILVDGTKVVYGNTPTNRK